MCFCPCPLPVGLRLRAARQDPRDAEALHTSEEMMASFLPPSYIFPSTSALTSRLPTTAHAIFLNLFCLFSSIKVHEMLQLVSASS